MLTKQKVVEMTEALAKFAGRESREACETRIAEMTDAEKIEWLLEKVQRMATSDMYLRLRRYTSQEIERLYNNTIEK